MNFLKKPEEIKDLYRGEGYMGCFATNRITVDGMKVGYVPGGAGSGFPLSGQRLEIFCRR